MIQAGQAALRGGVTTVRDLGDRGYLSLGLRGRPGLPTIVAAGPPLTTPGGTRSTARARTAHSWNRADGPLVRLEPDQRDIDPKHDGRRGG